MIILQDPARRIYQPEIRRRRAHGAWRARQAGGAGRGGAGGQLPPLRRRREGQPQGSHGLPPHRNARTGRLQEPHHHDCTLGRCARRREAARRDRDGAALRGDDAGHKRASGRAAYHSAACASPSRSCSRSTCAACSPARPCATSPPTSRRRSTPAWVITASTRYAPSCTTAWGWKTTAQSMRAKFAANVASEKSACPAGHAAVRQEHRHESRVRQRWASANPACACRTSATCSCRRSWRRMSRGMDFIIGVQAKAPHNCGVVIVERDDVYQLHPQHPRSRSWRCIFTSVLQSAGPATSRWRATCVDTSRVNWRIHYVLYQMWR